METSATYEEYGAFLWLLAHLRLPYLSDFAQNAAQSEDEDILDVVEGYIPVEDAMKRSLSVSMNWRLRSRNTRSFTLKIISYLDDTFKKPIFLILVWLASWKHEDSSLVYEILFSMDRRWLLEQLPKCIEQVLAHQIVGETYEITGETYQIFAELLSAVQSPYLIQFLQQTKQSENAEIRKVAEIFEI